MNGFTLKTVKIGALLNSPPLLSMMIVALNLDIFPVAFVALMWANIPLQHAGMASLFDQSQLQFSKVGSKSSSTGCLVFHCVFLANRIRAS